MFNVFFEVEKIVSAHVESDQVYVRDSFEQVIGQLAELKLEDLIGCSIHRENLVPDLIFEYVVLRFRFQEECAKELMARDNAARNVLRKLTKR
jgi:hypothetical protein